jgi:hypothetical protein
MREAPAMQQLPGAFPIAMGASATLDRQMLRFSPGWQIAFLGETEPRAARPEDVPGE